ncbi:cytochrome P450 [Exidia glandulosa HHB12029]|uniref:Cytochrome P450 n=1 Tax=Exidia glandulosa HHB12029 TaxID=1314781 RepID=A0A165ET37_EXIGL|nr:cytochrome P450 [Exidia glandulosa HHB12029]
MVVPESISCIRPRPQKPMESVSQFSWSTLGFAAAGSAISLISIYALFNKGSKRYPPGPPQYPFVGNYPHMPVGWTGKHFAEVAKIYGPIVYFRVPGRQFIVLNELEDAVALFEKRGNLYSDRPHMHMAHELANRKVTILFSQHAVAVIVKLVYGDTVSGVQDSPYPQWSKNMAHLTSTSSKPGRWLVDSFRWMAYIPDWFPGADFKRIAKQWRSELDAFTREPMVRAKKRMQDGTAERCFVVDKLEEAGTSLTPQHEEHIKYAAAGMYSGGVDSQSSFITIMLLCMTKFPDVQKKAHEELDRVVGTDRLPRMEDAPRLPYIESVIKEVHRIHPVVNLIPHATYTEDYYKGHVHSFTRRYQLMQGDAADTPFPQELRLSPMPGEYTGPLAPYFEITGRRRAMSRNETMYPDPERFDPDRFLDERAKDAVDPRQYVFGFGRRRCPGTALTDAFVALTVTSILSVFDIERAHDEDGNEIIPELKFDDGLTSQDGHRKKRPRVSTVYLSVRIGGCIA